MAPTRTSPTENTGYTDDTHPYRSLSAVRHTIITSTDNDRFTARSIHTQHTPGHSRRCRRPVQRIGRHAAGIGTLEPLQDTIARRRYPGGMVPLRTLSARKAVVHDRPTVPRRGLLRTGGLLHVRRTPSALDDRTGRGAYPRPVCRTGRQSHPLLHPRGRRWHRNSQRSNTQPGTHPCRQHPQMGHRQYDGHQQRPGPFRRPGRVVRRGGRRCPLLRRGDVPQKSRSPRGVERGERPAVCSPSAPNRIRRMGGAPSRRSPDLQYLYLQPDGR